MSNYDQRTEDLWATLDPQDEVFIAAVDEARLATERQRLPEQRRTLLKTPTYGLKNRFSMWESLVRRMEQNWAPSGYYLVDEYLNDLSSRSALSEILADAPDTTRTKLSQALSALDERFFQNTVVDGGIELGRWRANRPPNILPFLWERKPRHLPWN
ncbi:hypothetical protein [Nocardia beijingensis]|uniref:hypothetical protein n=1 Tax=Nocardia beijingensis TaxID=95162 RepID=UPI000AE45A2D|nr:hypothetical protein [Nocardia beijingensis]